MSESFKELSHVLGENAALSFCEMYGGQTIRIPTGTRPCSIIDFWEEVMGEEATSALIAHFKGSKLYVPKNHAEALKARNARIVEALEGGCPASEVARAFNLSMTQVSSIYRAFLKTLGV